MSREQPKMGVGALRGDQGNESREYRKQSEKFQVRLKGSIIEMMRRRRCNKEMGYYDQQL